MGDHHHFCPGIDAASKGEEFCAAIILNGSGRPCGTGVGVRLCISETREMFEAGRNSVFVKAVHITVNHLSAELRIAAEGTVAYGHIAGVNQYIRVRSKIQVETKFLQIGADGTAGLVRRFGISGRTYTSHAADIGHFDCTVADAHDISAFLINGKKGREY